MTNRSVVQAKKPIRRQLKHKPATSTSPKYLVIGKVLRPHGIRGELRLEIHTDTPHHLRDVATVYLGQEHRAYTLSSFRLHSGVLLVTLAEVPDRNEAELLRGVEVAVKLEDATPLKDGEFYHHQIVGLKVVTDEGEELGSVVEIITTGANDVYVVRGEKEVLLPAIKSVILKIDPPTHMVVHLLDGLR